MKAKRLRKFLPRVCRPHGWRTSFLEDSVPALHVIEGLPPSIAFGGAIVPGGAHLKLEDGVDLPVVDADEVVFEEVFGVKEEQSRDAHQDCFVIVVVDEWLEFFAGSMRAIPL